MADGALIGIDVGATSIKAGAFDETGELLALATRPNEPVPDGPAGWYAWDVDRVWDAVAGAVREVTRDREPVAVAVTGFGADGAPVGQDGVQRRPVISWHDGRTAADLAAIVEAIGERRLYDVTGYHAYPMNTICRWRWLARNEPAAVEGATWLMVPDLVAHRLCGERVSEPTGASTTMALDLAAGDWGRDLLTELDVPTSLPAELVSPGARIGSVTRAAAEATGLPEGLPVVAGGHDAEVVALAAGALPDGTALDVSGTWEIVVVRHDRFEPRDDFFAHGIDWEADVVPGRYLCVALMPSGSVVNWLRDIAYPNGDGWAALIGEAAAAPVGANGVSVVPAFVRGFGPHRDAAGGRFDGLLTTTTRSDLARAVFESLCAQLRASLTLLERLHDRPFTHLRVCGGAQKNPFWLQLKADATGCVTEAVPHEELTLLGAALLAGVGAGVYASVDEAVAAAARPARAMEPDAAAARAYAELFA